MIANADGDMLNGNAESFNLQELLKTAAFNNPELI